MKLPVSTSILFSLCALVFQSVLPQTQAQTYLVNWGGDYLDQEASGQMLNLGPDTSIPDAAGNMMGVGFGYDDAMPKSPLAARYDAQKPSALFYGVLQVMNPVIPENGDPAKQLRSFSQVKALARKNAIGFGSVPAKDGQTTEMTGMVYWRKSEFLQGGTDKIPWSKIMNMSLSVLGINSRGGTGSIRFAIRNGDTWYLSESEQQKGGIFVLHDSQWGEWKGLGADFPLPEVPAEFTTSANQLTDITAVGVFFHASSSTPGVNAVFTFNAFQVEARP